MQHFDMICQLYTTVNTVISSLSVCFVEILVTLGFSQIIFFFHGKVQVGNDQEKA